MKLLKSFKFMLLLAIPNLLLGFQIDPGYLFDSSSLEEQIEQDVVITNQNGVSIYQKYDKSGRLIELSSSDGTIDYSVKYFSYREFEIKDNIKNMTVKRILDEKGRLVCEIFPGNITVELTYDKDNLKQIDLKNAGSIIYEYNQTGLSKITRFSEAGETLYQHCYLINTPTFREEELPGGLGKVSQCTLKDTISIRSPFGKQSYSLNDKGKIISKNVDGEIDLYIYDDDSRLLLGSEYDDTGFPANGIVKEGRLVSYDETQCEYDNCGNLIKKETDTEVSHFYYDALNRLTQVKTGSGEVCFSYDIFNRRLSKTSKFGDAHKVERSTYLGNCELAIYNNEGEVEHLRVPGASVHPSVLKAISIESRSNIYVPIYNPTCHVHQLIDIESKDIIDFSLLDPFGQNLEKLSNSCPWIFSTKHYDIETGLVYFGHRYYDPSLKLWTTQDPLKKDGDNPYLYNLNDPINNIDPDGRFVFVLPLLPLLMGATVGEVVALTAATTLAVAAGVATGVAIKEHTKNKRPSTKSRHEKGQARQKREQARAKERQAKNKKNKR